MTYVRGHMNGNALDLLDPKGTPVSPPLGSGCRLLIARSDCTVFSFPLGSRRRRRARRFIAKELPSHYPGTLSAMEYDFVVQHSNSGSNLLVILIDRGVLSCYRKAAGSAGLTVLAEPIRFALKTTNDRFARRFVIEQGEFSELLSLTGKVVTSSFLLTNDGSPTSLLTGEITTSREVAGSPDEYRPIEHLSDTDVGRLLDRRPASHPLFQNRKTKAYTWSSTALPFLSFCVLLAANLLTYRLIPGRIAERAALQRSLTSIHSKRTLQRLEASEVDRLRRELVELAAAKPIDLYDVLSKIAADVAELAEVRDLTLADGQLRIVFSTLSADALLSNLIQGSLPAEYQLVETSSTAAGSNVTVRRRVR